MSNLSISQSERVASPAGGGADSVRIAGATRFLDLLFGRHPPSNVAFRLWEGTHWPAINARRATLVLKDAGSLRRMFEPGTEKALAEAYLQGDFDIIGDMECAFEIADALSGKRRWRDALTLANLIRRLPTSRREEPLSGPTFDHRSPRHSLERDRKAISFHYDLSNDYYRLWLDAQLVYSCAYFRTTKDDLDTAQAAKIDYLCRKLRLKAGQRLLDIGCGWGGLACHAASCYGVRVTGVTLSQEQASWARDRILREGLGEQVEIRCEDYRSLEDGQTFDAVVSVGMSEHVGTSNLAGYFSKVWKLLRPGGVFLNHAIGEGCSYRPSRGPSFIDQYVFPDSDIPPIPTVLEAAAAAGFEVRDVENLREHYTLTLRHWVQRLEAKHSEALTLVSEPTYRTWLLYMAGSAYGFDHGRLAVYQALLARPDEAGRAHVPLTRSDWYA